MSALTARLPIRIKKSWSGWLYAVHDGTAVFHPGQRSRSAHPPFALDRDGKSGLVWPVCKQLFIWWQERGTETSSSPSLQASFGNERFVESGTHLLAHISANIEAVRIS